MKKANIEFSVISKGRLELYHSKTTSECELKGPVQKVEQYVCKASFQSGCIVQGEMLVDIHIDDTITAWFDENGKKYKQEHHWHEDSSVIELFNEQLLVSETYFENRERESHSKKKYDEAGRLIEMLNYDGKNVFTGGHTRKYDDRGNLIIMETYGPQMNLTETMVNVFNELNEKTEDKRTKVDGEVTYWAKIKYDSHHHECERTMLNADGSVKETSRHRNMYDHEGKKIGQDDNLYSDWVELDEALIEHDAHGNWITKIKFYNSVPLGMVFREINYFGEEEKPSNKEHVKANPIEYAYTHKNISEWERRVAEEKVRKMFENPAPKIRNMDPELVRWLTEVATLDVFPLMKYYSLVNNDIPTLVHFNDDDFEVRALYYTLRDEMDAELIHSRQERDFAYEENSMERFTLIFPNRGYVLQTSPISVYDDAEYKIPDFIRHSIYDYDGGVHIATLTLLRPSLTSGKRDEDFESTLRSIMELCILETLPDKPEISMVEVGPNGNFLLKSYPVYDNFLIKDLDMHYGYGFEKFHNELMGRFEKQSKGLVLFHGLPGTGKTFYIRHLLRKMTSKNKVVIYMPPNMVDRLVDPYFITFLAKELANQSLKGNFCVLLIEDAEPLLASRQGEGRVMGISNLLNMTDGILNDMLKLQIICTFNVKVKELDKALLRPGRLIARKEFKAMTALDANRLAQQLGVKHHFNKPVTLSEVYAHVKNNNTLTHGDELDLTEFE